MSRCIRAEEQGSDAFWDLVISLLGFAHDVEITDYH